MTVRVFDFFSGCGGTSCGFEQAGMDIVMGLDIDPDSAATFQTNFPRAKFFQGDIRDLNTNILAPLIRSRKAPILFCGCAPCQPFSKQNRTQSKRDPRRNLLAEFERFVKAWLPDYVFIENVPGMQKVEGKKGPFQSFTQELHDLGYEFSSDVLPAMSFGVPQTRKRLVLLASRHGFIGLPDATHGPNKKEYSNVREWIEALPPIAAGETHPKDPDHQAAVLTSINLERISVTPEGGGRESWPPHLQLNCHKDHDGHTDVYGRLAWDKLAAGLTTRCISYSNGRFGHPVQNRGLSVREAALLQTFPKQYKFIGSLQSKARQVGNAVPPAMARAVGSYLIRKYQKGC
jgi:DNA (cytosine-5)-methyltransferase 1